jgi:hypothetical protein
MRAAYFAQVTPDHASEFRRPLTVRFGALRVVIVFHLPAESASVALLSRVLSVVVRAWLLRFDPIFAQRLPSR